MTRAEARVAYEALQKAQEVDGSVVPLCTVDRYTGEHDEAGRFHGKGTLASSMGFTYVGDFVRGQIEGVGTMTWTDGYSVEGVFRDGVPNGKGTITWATGDVYAGDLVNGVRHGVGTMSTLHGKASYDGGWEHGVRHGWGRQCYPDGSLYEGEWLGNQRHGRGMLLYANGDCYEGEWAAGVRQGHGAMGWRHGNVDGSFTELYNGQWDAGAPHGLGQSIYIVYARDKPPRETGEGARPSSPAALDGNDASPRTFSPPSDAIVNMYRGSFVKGERAGRGAFFYADGSSYKGDWAEGKKNGNGTFTTAVGIAHRGTFANDLPVDMPSLVTVNASGPAVVPVVNIGDLRGIGDGTQEAADTKMASLLLRFNTTLKGLFTTYAVKADDVAFAYTPQDWWRHRVPGHISIPQFLRLLSDAELVDGLVTLSDILHCILQVVQAESHSGEDTGDETLSVVAVEDIARAEGWLSYAQFAEALIRLAPSVCVGAGCCGGICDKFNSLVEGRLKGELACVPLCRLTRAHAEELAPVLAPLEELYHELVLLDSEDPAPASSSFLEVRGLLAFLQPLLASYDISLQEAVRIMCPFQRSSATSRLPPGFNIPAHDRQLELAQELYAMGCGKEGRGKVSLLVSGVIVEQHLALVDFVEAVVALALMLREKDAGCGRDLQQIIETKVLLLPL